MTTLNVKGIFEELKMLNKQYIDCLHITSWDQDHCEFEELSLILENLKPRRIEYPGYLPHTDNARKCKRLIESYNGHTESITPEYINALSPGEERKYSNILYNPISLLQFLH